MAKQYDKKFKQEAIQYRLDHPELTNAAVCRNLGISAPSFYNWLSDYKKQDGDIQHRGSGNLQSDEQKEIERLKRELQIKDDALTILKKRSASWAKKNRSNIFLCT